ncbi:DUF2946 family protein [Gluconacetobacter entanii]|uniref:DUF2946 family protein n=1 Tax=Gluconacetobacter entanii TaxID=108528 RepID=UPI001E342AA8|nr:DUF2946 family protein [Gluconacetobacter entanii]MCE2579509.1 DUF2946 family protein [Komagataeibacter sp. FNDCR1]MCW4579093.1 DUF2946 family protein [Gluconacetobacter entanii]MCW4582496.1 DUF2946 family protein [Gluconacetobacter entanii]MCW4585880.1 DUF2946 family protein [Gluconacetobacter entanii]
MARIPHPVTGQTALRWLVVACTLLGFVGQLLVLGRALPGEMPRATIARLTGIDIAPPAPMAGCDDTTMAMGEAPAAIGHAVAHALGHGLQHDTAHHDHDGSCTLCPLLHLPAIALAALPFMPLPPMAWARARVRPGQPRAPPAISPGIPPSRGPPPAA